MAVAEAEPDPAKARELMVAGMVDLAVERRRMESMLLGDPVLVRFFAHYPPFHAVMDRLYRLLVGDAATPETRLPAAMLSAAIAGAAMHPLVSDLDDKTLREQLIRLARRSLDMPDRT